MEAAIITTYRCNAACRMCNIWKFPTRAGREITPEVLAKLPALRFCNITGGEPFLRDDLPEIIAVLKKRARRIVISTNGYLTDRIVAVARAHRDVGVRISLEGLPAVNDELRGLKNGFDHGLRTLLELVSLGVKDIGFGITVSDRNAGDLLPLFRLARAMNIEFATAVVHNSYYFHKSDNRIENKDTVISAFSVLVRELLASGRAKNWFRAYFNYGLIQYVKGGNRLLSCGAGKDMFFLDPFGEVRPCNGLDAALPENSMGNLGRQAFAEIWHGERAKRIREQLAGCRKNCWMIGSAGPAIKSHMGQAVFWILRNKLFGFGGPRQP
jgi:radical SAM protein with 4Fe4S-binding SPASM domain